MKCYCEHLKEHIGNLVKILKTWWKHLGNLMKMHWEQKKAKKEKWIVEIEDVPWSSWK
jgi:hypothetical protein